MTVDELLSRAERLAEDILFPAAMAVDGADLVPAEHLDAFAAAGLYGLAGPADAGGGQDFDPAVYWRIVEVLASGCLATTFVWLQHHGAVRALAATANDRLRAEWLRRLCLGQRRAGVALAGARPGPPLLRATRVPGGYLLNGNAPWVTGWGRVDVLYTLARCAETDLVAALVPAVAGPELDAHRHDLVAVNASGTVELAFSGYFVPDELVCAVFPHARFLASDAAGLRPNGSLSLGVAARCCQLIGPSALDAELAAARARLDAADADTLPAARAAASELAFRAAGAAVTAAGSAGILAASDPQRLAREALFLLVFGSRPPIKSGVLHLLACRRDR
jgi:alkylation response protein AidB-like acyl-CoA dehydrogenase